jgi:hypothetical protein
MMFVTGTPFGSTMPPDIAIRPEMIDRLIVALKRSNVSEIVPVADHNRPRGESDCSTSVNVFAVGAT